MRNQWWSRLDRGAAGSDRRSVRALGILLAIANSVRNDRFHSRILADGEFVDLLVRFSAVDRYDGADRPHVIAAVGESVFVVRLFRFCRDAVSDRGRCKGSLHGYRRINAARRFSLQNSVFVLSMRDHIEGSHKVPQPFSKAWAAKLFRLGLGCKRSYSEQRDREAKITQANSWLSQAVTNDHSLRSDCPQMTPPCPLAGRYPRWPRLVNFNISDVSR